MKYKYERRDVFIVIDRKDGAILAVLGVESGAELYVLRHGNAYVSRWPVEFRKPVAVDTYKTASGVIHRKLRKE